MRKVYMELVLTVLMLISAACGYAVETGEPVGNKITEEIWRLEEAYFTRLYQADYEGVLKLTHPQFLGWPQAQAGPLDFEASSRFMKQLIPGPTPCKIKITRAGIRVAGNTALTQYDLHVDCGRAPDAKPIRPSRITHTWIHDGVRWRLLGGMSCEVK